MKSMLDKATVQRIARDHYNIAYDARMLPDQFLTRIRAQGWLGREDLVRIVRWKAWRAVHWALRNDDETVRLVTGWAFGAPGPRLAAHALTYLAGVGVRMATAVLAVHDPETYTVMDVRSWATLERVGLEGLGLSGDMRPDDGHCSTYGAYLAACRRLAEDIGVPLRTLDRCLWALNGKTPDEMTEEKQ